MALPNLILEAWRPEVPEMLGPVCPELSTAVTAFKFSIAAELGTAISDAAVQGMN